VTLETLYRKVSALDTLYAGRCAWGLVGGLSVAAVGRSGRGKEAGIGVEEKVVTSARHYLLAGSPGALESFAKMRCR